MNLSTTQVGEILQSAATHHFHGEGWKYSRDVGGLKHIRYKRDYTGYNHWTKRYARAFNLKKLLGVDKTTKMIWNGHTRDRSPKDIFLEAVAYFLVQIQLESNLPDGQINGNLTFWEEDGEYIEMVGPTVGEKIAKFLMEDPENPYAIEISSEIQRIWALDISDS